MINFFKYLFVACIAAYIGNTCLSTIEPYNCAKIGAKCFVAQHFYVNDYMSNFNTNHKNDSYYNLNCSTFLTNCLRYQCIRSDHLPWYERIKYYIESTSNILFEQLLDNIIWFNKTAFLEHKSSLEYILLNDEFGRIDIR